MIFVIVTNLQEKIGHKFYEGRDFIYQNSLDRYCSHIQCLFKIKPMKEKNIEQFINWTASTYFLWVTILVLKEKKSKIQDVVSLGTV